MLIDTAGEEQATITKEGADDGAQVKADQEVNKDVSIEAGDAGVDGGGEDREVEKADSEEGSETGEVEKQVEESVPAEESDVIKGLRAEIAELKGMIKPVQPPPQQEVAPKMPEMTDEQWAKLEDEWGQPRTAIQRNVENQIKVYQEMKKYVDSQLSEFRFDKALRTLAQDKEYSDALKYESDIKEYLTRVAPAYHSNLDVLKDGLTWSRGKHFKQGIQNVRNEKEINKKIAGVARPASPGAPVHKKSTQLTPLQKHYQEMGGMSEAEYNKFKSMGGKAIE